MSFAVLGTGSESLCSASAEERQNDFYIVAGCGKATPSLEFKTESRARGTMWLALLPPATKRAGDAFGGPPPGPQRGRRCSAPPFSFLLINSPASLISPDEMRPREHCPPAQPFGALIILPAGGRRGWRARSCTRTDTHRSTH